MPLSFSQLSLYRRCPRQYEFAVIKKIDRPISTAEAFGSSVHNTLKKWGDLEMGGRGLGVGNRDEDVPQLGLFADAAVKESDHTRPLTLETLQILWRESFILDAYPTRMEADFDRVRGQGLMESFFAWWSAIPRTVLSVESGFSLAAGAVTLSGRFDRIEECEGGLRVIDFKTSPSRTQEEVDSDLQLSIYALASAEVFGKPCVELSFLFLGEEGVTERVTTRSASQLKDAITQISSVAERIEAKDMRPTPSVAVCKHCPYRRICDVAAVR